MKLGFTRRAGRNIAAIAEFIGKDSPSAAERVGVRIHTACALLTEFPEMGRPGIRQGTREISLRGLPYIIVYRRTDDEIIVLGVYHERQLRPGQSEL